MAGRFLWDSHKPSVWVIRAAGLAHASLWLKGCHRFSLRQAAAPDAPCSNFLSQSSLLVAGLSPVTPGTSPGHWRPSRATSHPFTLVLHAVQDKNSLLRISGDALLLHTMYTAYPVHEHSSTCIHEDVYKRQQGSAWGVVFSWRKELILLGPQKFL